MILRVLACRKGRRKGWKESGGCVLLICSLGARQDALICVRYRVSVVCALLLDDWDFGATILEQLK